MSGSAALVRGDAIRLPLRAESVDLIVTSPPYFALRSYKDDGEHYGGQIGSEETPQAFLEALWTVTAECWRVLKPTGSLFVNLGDKYAGSGGHNNSNIGAKKDRGPSRYNQDRSVPAKSLYGLPWRYALGCIDRGWVLRAEIVWSKPNALPESVTDRVRRSHEQWFHLTKQGAYFSSVDEIREPHNEATVSRYQYAKNNTRENRTGALHEDGKTHQGPLRTDIAAGHVVNPLGKLPSSVWTLATEPLTVPAHLPQHFAAFPQEWPRRLILGWSPPGICTACGEGRRPLVEADDNYRAATALRGDFNSHKWDGGYDPESGFGAGANNKALPNPQWSIVGHACACADTDAPTRPSVVLDPFAGTGTVPMVARSLGRYGVGIDLSADYLRLARWRVFDSGHAAKTVRRTNEERQGVLL